MRILKITTTTILSLMMVFTMMPLTDLGAVHAASASGGTVTVDTTDDAKATAKAAFGLGDDDVSISGDTLTIGLKEDLVLDDPVRFVKGTAGKKAVLKLNGHTITGRAGSTSGELSDTLGGNAIEIAADEFDVEISGPGSVVGGKGAVYQPANGVRQGQWGGNAVFFVNDGSNEEYLPDELEHGLTVTGGAVLAGGAGADVDFDDWCANIGTNAGDNRFLIEAGRGGDGISQEYTGIDYGTTLEEQTFARIDILSGSVNGGAGGKVNIGNSHPLTYNYISGLQPVKDMISRSPDYGKRYFNGWFFDRIRLSQGNGGNGILFAAGRKYISVEEGSAVNGGDGGYIDFGNKGKHVNKVQNTWNSNHYSSDLYDYNQGAGGSGISGWGDVGLTNDEPTLSASNWNSKAKNAGDIGIYIAGDVKGGNAASTNAITDRALEGGDAIKINTGEYSYCKAYPNINWNNEVGIIFVDTSGSVAGGNGGSALTGDVRKGGDGIFENESSIVPGASADHYLIKGDVIGGNGGNGGTNSYGAGGHGIQFKKKYQKNKTIAGSGTIRAGNYGSVQYSDYYKNRIDANNRILNDGHLQFETAVYGLEDEDIDYLGNSTRTDGGYAYVRRDSLNGFNASVVMTPLNGHPTANTTLECNVTRPSGYGGDVYYRWSAHVGGGINETLDIEGSGTDIQKFNLLGYADYHSTTVYESYEYNINVLTHESLYQHIRYNDTSPVTISCEAILEDGRTVKSNVLTLKNTSQTGNGQSGGSGGETGQSDDEILAASVESMIEDITDDIDSIDPDWDGDFIDTVLDRYNGLSDYQKSLISQEARDKLTAAIKRLAELRGEEQDDQEQAAAVTDLIDALDDLDLGSIVQTDNDTIEEARNQIIAAKTAYDTLTDEQKVLVVPDKVTKLNEAIRAINDLLPPEQKINESEVLEPIDISDANISIATATYTGKDVKPELTVMVNGETLKKKDFTADYSNNINAGSDASVTITGKGLYSGNATKSFTIDPASINNADVSGITNKTYSGSAQTQNPVVKVAGRTLENGTDYILSFRNNINAGTATVTIAATGNNYTGAISKNYNIARKGITPTVTLSKTSYTWNNKVQRPGVTVKFGGKALKNGTDYSIGWSAGRNVGRHSCKVTLKGNYSGAKTVYFKINPKGTSISKFVRAKNGFTVKWKRQASKMSSSVITGYQIQYSLKKNFKSGNKTVTVKGYKSVSKKVGKLKKNKYYYVKIRTYKKLSGVTYYSPWSAVKRVKTK